MRIHLLSPPVYSLTQSGHRDSVSAPYPQPLARLPSPPSSRYECGPHPGACWWGKGGVAVKVCVGASLGGVPGPGADLYPATLLPPQSGRLREDERAPLRPWVTLPPPHTIWPPWGPPQAGHLCCPAGTPTPALPLFDEGRPLWPPPALRLPQSQQTGW